MNHKVTALSSRTFDHKERFLVSRLRMVFMDWGSQQIVPMIAASVPMASTNHMGICGRTRFNERLHLNSFSMITAQSELLHWEGT